MSSESAGRSRAAWVINSALVAPFVLLLAVTVMTWRAEKRYAVVTDRVIHDYAAIAAWQFARRSDSVLHDEVMNAFKPIASTLGHQRIGPHSRIVSAAPLVETPATESAFAGAGRARFALAFDAGSGELTLTGASLGDAERSELADALLAVARQHGRGDDPHRVIFVSVGGRSQAIALWIMVAPAPAGAAIYGLAADPDALRPVFLRVIEESNLLPGSTSRPNLTENDIAVRLARPDGVLVFVTNRDIGRTAATDSGGLQRGALRTTVDLAPHLANALLVGGAPRSQVPVLVLLTLVAAILALLSVLHQHRARELQSARERFVANVSHELRTPLAQISMFAETLALGRERNSDERRDFAAIILAEARRLTTLVERVMRASRRDDGARTLVVQLRPASVHDEIAAAVHAFEPVAQAADVTLTTALGDDTRVNLDADAFRQVLLNLLENAVKHAGRGSRVNVSTHLAADEVRVVVEDSGPGIPADWRERVFDEFVRLEGTTVAGAGIGLAVVRDLVAAHSGRVWIADSEFGGARFVVALPLFRGETATRAGHDMAAAAGA